MKKILSTALVLVLVVALSIAGTVAYLQDDDTVINTFTVGNVEILLDEAPVEKDENGQYVADTEAPRIQENEYETLVPGQTVPKDPMVTNIGANAAWIRVDITVTDYSVFAAVLGENADLTACFGEFASDSWTPVGLPAVDVSANTVTYSYYYNSKLDPEANTGAIFESVTIPEGFTADKFKALGDGFEITLVAHAIQADGFGSAAEAFDKYV